MHETSLVRSLLTQVEHLAHEHGSPSVKQIELEIGPLTGVEPLLVRQAFDLLIEDTASANAELVIHEVPLTARCETCQTVFTMDGFHFQCPSCESTSIRVTRGDAFRLLNITLEIPQPEESPA